MLYLSIQNFFTSCGFVKKIERKAFSNCPAKTAPRTSRGKLGKDGFARRKSKSELCCIIASQVCLGERVAFSRHGSAKPPTGTQSVPARGPLLLHAPVQIGLSRQNSPPDWPGAKPVRAASRAGVKVSVLHNCFASLPRRTRCVLSAWLRQAAYGNAERSRERTFAPARDGAS